jgi:hypothetical protein
MTADILAENHGSVFTLTPMTEAARDWIDENCHIESWQYMGASFAVDRRVAFDIVQRALNDGLTCE